MQHSNCILSDLDAISGSESKFMHTSNISSTVNHGNLGGFIVAIWPKLMVYCTGHLPVEEIWKPSSDQTRRLETPLSKPTVILTVECARENFFSKLSLQSNIPSRTPCQLRERPLDYPLVQCSCCKRARTITGCAA